MTVLHTEKREVQKVVCLHEIRVEGAVHFEYLNREIQATVTCKKHKKSRILSDKVMLIFWCTTFEFSVPFGKFTLPIALNFDRHFTQFPYFNFCEFE